MPDRKDEIASQLHQRDVIDRAVNDYESGKYDPTNSNPLVNAGLGSTQQNEDYYIYEAAWKTARDNDR